MKQLLLIFLLIIFPFTGICQYNFTKYPANPILQRNKVFGVWDAIALSDPCVIYSGDTLKMWYTGVGWLSISDSIPHQRIGYAWSLDGINWNQYTANPVIDITAGAWDDLGLETATVIIDSTAPLNKKYKMWYAGQNSITQTYNIGYAYSADGINWTKSVSNPVLQIGTSSSWENEFLEGPSVLQYDDTLRMWYASIDLTGDGQPTDFTGNIGYAWSLDGANWTKSPANPVFRSYDSPNWDQASVADPHVIRKDGQYLMWYAGLHSWTNENFKMGYAVSSDGINWTRPTIFPVLEIGAQGEWDDEDASYGCVVFDSIGHQYKMWYTGRDTSSLPPDLNAYYYDIGYATLSTTNSIKATEHSKSQAIVYPNPTTDKAIIHFSNSFDFSKLIIVNVLGQSVNIPISLEDNYISLNMENVSSGIYYCILYAKKSREKLQLIIYKTN